MITVRLSRMSGRTVKPTEYLGFARRDLVEGDTRAMINALSNIKRAIDSQLDILLEMYGLLRLAMKERWPFPKKIEVIRRTGIVSPNILKLINSKRVELEHYHRRPAKEEVMEFADIAELFTELFKWRAHRIEVLIDYDSDFAFWMDTSQDTIRIYNNTDFLLEAGGIESFKRIVQERDLQPIQTIAISDLDSWTDACARYIRR